MPLYTYVCSTCRKEYEAFSFIIDRDLKQKCPTCGKVKGERKFNPSGVKTQVWEPQVFDNIAPTPVLITSKKHLQEVCDKNGSYVVSHNPRKTRQYVEKRREAWNRK